MIGPQFPQSNTTDQILCSDPALDWRIHQLGHPKAIFQIIDASGGGGRCSASRLDSQKPKEN